jgi:hypothetical protein
MDMICATEIIENMTNKQISAQAALINEYTWI